YADAPYGATPMSQRWRFTSPDGKIVKTLTVPDGGSLIDAAYVETVSGPLYVRLGLSPSPLDLAFHGDANLVGRSLGMPCGPLPAPSTPIYELVNSRGGAARVTGSCGMQLVSSPADAGWNRRNVALTDQVELSGDGS